jgi:hypothetical protein
LWCGQPEFTIGRRVTWNHKITEVIIGVARQLENLTSSAARCTAEGMNECTGVLRLSPVEQADQTVSQYFGGIAADTQLPGSGTLRERLEYDPPGAEHAFWRDLREHIRHSEMPTELRRESLPSGAWEWAEKRDENDPGPSKSAQWLANRTWGRAVQIKQDHLREQGLTDRAYDQAMWEWKGNLERAARRNGDPLPFSPAIAGKEPYMGEIYRGDGRSRDAIFGQGFRPLREDLDADPMANNADGDAGLVFTSKNPNVAARFAKSNDGDVYVVQDARDYTDMNDRHGPQYLAHHFDEVAYTGVPADKVKGQLIDPRDPSAGLIPNPNFKPYESEPIRPPREDGD